jgi:hypothetical protein
MPAYTAPATTATYIPPPVLVTPIAPPGYEALAARIYLSSRTVDLVVFVFAGESQKGQHIVDLYSKALPPLEGLIGVPLPRDYTTVKVQEYKRQDLTAEALNYGYEIKVADTAIANDKALVHELTHYWYRQPKCANVWIVEGFAALYTILDLNAMGDNITATKMRNDQLTWYERYKNSIDFPLSEWTSYADLGTNRSGFAHGKAAVLSYGLYYRAGADAFKQVNIAAFSTSSSKMTQDSLLSGLSAATGQDFSIYAPGWIYPGVAQPLK